MDHQNRVRDESIDPGEPVYDSNGRLVGRVSSYTDHGFEAEPVGAGDRAEEEIPGQEFGEGYLMWRCGECGEMDELEGGMPETCPDCGAPKEAISAERED